MRNKRTIAWSSALQELRDEPPPAAVREERLRAAMNLRPGSLPLSAWRGKSGRRYVVALHPLTDATLLDSEGAVVIAVAREEDGSARVVSALSAEPEMMTEPRGKWLGEIRRRGATELHVHRLVDGRAERRAAVADLTDLGSPDATSSTRASGPGAR